MAPDDSEKADKVDLDSLYLQETFTDLGMGTIQRLTPVRPDGGPDAARAPLFMGSATIMTQHGPLPVQCDIDAPDLKTACEKFPDAIRDSVENLIQRAQRMERERQGGIVIAKPGQIELP